MRAIFDPAFDHLMVWEGGYVNDPDDPGGVTNWGIAMNRIGRVLGLRKEDIINMKRSGAKEIYKPHYWDKVRGDDLPIGIDLAAFDGAVNQGVTASIRLLQRAAGVKADGKLGPVTLEAVRHANPERLLRDYMVYRALHYSGLSKIWKYGRGWFRRLFSTHRAAVLAQA